MKNRWQIIAGISLVFLLIISMVYLKMNPPLHPTGTSYYTDQKKRVIEIENHGFVHVNIKNVLVNGSKAKKVELGASRTDHLVGGAFIDEDPYITFHDINELEVQPQLSPKEQTKLYKKGDKEVIKHYGLRMIGYEIPEKITIKYTYLGIPFTLQVDVKE